MRNRIVACSFLVMIILSDTGCASIRIRTDAAQGETTEASVKTVAVHRWLWGYAWNSEAMISTCRSKALQAVEVKTNFWQTVVTIASLGIYCPATVKVVCAAARPPSPPCPEK